MTDNGRYVSMRAVLTGASAAATILATGMVLHTQLVVPAVLRAAATDTRELIREHAERPHVSTVTRDEFARLEMVIEGLRREQAETQRNQSAIRAKLDEIGEAVKKLKR